MSRLHYFFLFLCGIASFGSVLPFVYVGSWSDAQTIALDIGEQVTYEWEMDDYWKTAEEVITDGMLGDCEDVANYAATTIKDLYPESDVMMISLKGHMVFQVDDKIIDVGATFPVLPASWLKDEIIYRWEIRFYNEQVIPTHNEKGYNLPSMF